MSLKVSPKYRGTSSYTEAYQLLIQVAKSKSRIGYAPVFEILGLRPGNHASREAGQLLGEISEDANRAGLPLLSAVVVTTTTRRPGDGFFVLAESLGRIRKGLTASERDAFWRNELNRVYATEWPPFADRTPSAKRVAQVRA